MDNLKDVIFKISAIIILLSAVAFSIVPKIALWTMIGGVCTFSIIIATSPYPGKSIRGKRLFGIQLVACASMFVSAYLMFQQKNEWVLTMLVAAILLLYTAFLIPKELSKEKNETHTHS